MFSRVQEPAKYDLVAQLLPGLWVGGWAALNNDCFVLKQKGVTHVLSVHSQDTQRKLPSFIKGALLVAVDDRDDADMHRWSHRLPDVLIYIQHYDVQ